MLFRSITGDVTKKVFELAKVKVTPHKDTKLGGLGIQATSNVATIYFDDKKNIFLKLPPSFYATLNEHNVPETVPLEIAGTGEIDLTGAIRSVSGLEKNSDLIVAIAEKTKGDFGIRYNDKSKFGRGEAYIRLEVDENGNHVARIKLRGGRVSTAERPVFTEEDFPGLPQTTAPGLRQILRLGGQFGNMLKGEYRRDYPEISIRDFIDIDLYKRIIDAPKTNPKLSWDAYQKNKDTTGWLGRRRYNKIIEKAKKDYNRIDETTFNIASSKLYPP